MKKEDAKSTLHGYFEQAEQVFAHDPALAHKLVGKARRLAMKHTLRIPRELKRRFCKHCYHYLKQGKNVRVRRTEKGIVYTCGDCEKAMRFPLH